MKKLLFIYFLGWGWTMAQDSFDAVSLATDLLNGLSTPQKKIISFELEDPAKSRWHYLPHDSFAREGLPLSDMNSAQIQKTYALLEAYLSESGYKKMHQIIDLENYLALLENNPFKRDPSKYYIAFYGTTHRDSVWAWSFEGHHISLNFTITPKAIAFAPAFWGSNPGIVPDGPEKVKIVLKEDHDWGLELVQSLSSKQLEQALVSSKTYGEILTRNQPNVEFIPYNGISFPQLKTDQKKQLKKIIYLHLDRMKKSVTQKTHQLLENEDWNNITFSWAGKMEKLKAHYYRIQGQNFLIEYDNSQNNGNHIHTVWREFNGDFGKDLIKEHYLKERH
jgi:hypothetical protein